MDEFLGDPIPLDDPLPVFFCCNPDPPLFKPSFEPPIDPLPPVDPLFGG